MSPRSLARIAGAVYLLFFVTAIAGEVFLEQAGVSGIQAGRGNAAEITGKMLANRSAFQAGFALGLISVACYVALTGLFYVLFRPVSRTVSLIAMLFGLMGQAVGAFGTLFLLAPFVVLNGSTDPSVFDLRQQQALALVFLNLMGQVGNVGLIFDGLFLLLIGILIFRSTFLPRAIGLLVASAGVAWLSFLAPPLASRLMTGIEVLGVAAEGGLMLWLLVRGVNGARWNERARSGGLSPAQGGAHLVQEAEDLAV
jgi:hypothetical protein